jgi:hypothetical protein
MGTPYQLTSADLTAIQNAISHAEATNSLAPLKISQTLTLQRLLALMLSFIPEFSIMERPHTKAVRYLMRVTGTRIGFWWCPVRGLAVQYRKLPTTRYGYGLAFLRTERPDRDEKGPCI